MIAEKYTVEDFAMMDESDVAEMSAGARAEYYEWALAQEKAAKAAGKPAAKKAAGKKDEIARDWHPVEESDLDKELTALLVAKKAADQVAKTARLAFEASLLKKIDVPAGMVAESCGYRFGISVAFVKEADYKPKSASTGKKKRVSFKK